MCNNCNVIWCFYKKKVQKYFNWRKQLYLTLIHIPLVKVNIKNKVQKYFNCRKQLIIFNSHTHTIGQSEHVPFIIAFLSLNLYSNLVYLIFGQWINKIKEIKSCALQWMLLHHLSTTTSTEAWCLFILNHYI